jgi:FkbM family methyltransferase
MYRRATDAVCEPDFDALRLIPGLDNTVAVDVGANRGDTIQAIQMRTKNVKVMAFEPNPLVFSRLSKVYKGDSAVTLFNFGLADKDEIIHLNIPFYKKFMFDGLASFIPDAALGWLKTRIFFYNEKHLSLRQIECCLTRLDRFEIKPSFIKIDVQGFEYQVLLGAKETLRECRPIVLIETPTAEARQFMQDQDYLPYYFRKNKLHPGFGELNTFYIPSEKVDGIAR